MEGVGELGGRWELTIDLKLGRGRKCILGSKSF